MLFQDLGLFVLLLGSAVAEVPDPEEDLITIADAQSEYPVYSCSLRFC